MNDPSKLANIMGAALFGGALSAKAEELTKLARSQGVRDAEFLQAVKDFRQVCRLASAAADAAHKAAFRLTLEKWRAELEAGAPPLGRSPSVLPSQKQACPECGLAVIDGQCAYCLTRETRALGRKVRQAELPLPEPCSCGRTAEYPAMAGQPPCCRECADAVLAYRPRE